jgi:hypothetical protein
MIVMKSEYVTAEPQALPLELLHFCEPERDRRARSLLASNHGAAQTFY